jgi:hypothetical protein
MGEGKSAHNLVAKICSIDKVQAPTRHCHNITYWLFAVANKAVFDKDSEDFGTKAGLQTFEITSPQAGWLPWIPIYSLQESDTALCFLGQAKWHASGRP